MGELRVCLAFTSDDRKWKLRLAVVIFGATSARITLKLWISRITAMIKLLTRLHFFSKHTNISSFPWQVPSVLKLSLLGDNSEISLNASLCLTTHCNQNLELLVTHSFIQTYSSQRRQLALLRIASVVWKSCLYRLDLKILNEIGSIGCFQTLLVKCFLKE